MSSAAQATTLAPAYERIVDLLEAGEPVILDGANATELERAHARAGDLRNSDRGLWGTWALYDTPYAVKDVHRRYVDVPCDVISTNTWAVLAAAELDAGGPVRSATTHWLDVARLGIALARQAIDEGGRTGECAVAFSVNGDVDSVEREASLELLLRALRDDPPDLLLLETMSLIREGFTIGAIEAALASGIPVWLSFRRCRHGVCGVYGQHWGGPEGDLFGRAARRFEELGVSALLINCLPPEHLDGMLPWLRDFTDLPLGVYPNLGYFSDAGWRFDEETGPERYAELALAWREQGAQIVGGCCGISGAQILHALEWGYFTRRDDGGCGHWPDAWQSVEQRTVREVQVDQATGDGSSGRLALRAGRRGGGSSVRTPAYRWRRAASRDVDLDAVDERLSQVEIRSRACRVDLWRETTRRGDGISDPRPRCQALEARAHDRALDVHDQFRGHEQHGRRLRRSDARTFAEGAGPSDDPRDGHLRSVDDHLRGLRHPGHGGHAQQAGHAGQEQADGREAVTGRGGTYRTRCR